MIPGLEEMLRGHARANDLHRLDIGMMMVGGRVTFIATAWWDRVGYEIPCVSGIAENATAAIGIALDRADRERAEVRAAMAREPLLDPVLTIISDTRASVIL